MRCWPGSNRFERVRACSAGLRKATKREMESADKPGSVVDNHSSGTSVTTGLKQPTRKHPRAWAYASLFGLAPDGVYPAAECCHPRGALLPHHFTLTPPHPKTKGAVYFLWHFPWAHAPQVLPGILPAGARTFLPPKRAIVWPTPRRIIA
jgi:hypothetical protein